VYSKFSATGIGALCAHPTKVATAPASTAKLIAFENDMIPSYGLNLRGSDQMRPARLKNNSGRYPQQKQEKITLTTLRRTQFVVFGYSCVPMQGV
jgi:hypothetical protein